MASSSHREEEKAPPEEEEPPMAYSPYASPFFPDDGKREQWDIIGEQLPTTPPSLTGHHPAAPTVPTPAPTVPTPAPTASAAKEETAAKDETDALIVIIAILFDLYS